MSPPTTENERISDLKVWSITWVSYFSSKLTLHHKKPLKKIPVENDFAAIGKKVNKVINKLIKSSSFVLKMLINTLNLNPGAQESLLETLLFSLSSLYTPFPVLSLRPFSFCYSFSISSPSAISSPSYNYKLITSKHHPHLNHLKTLKQEPLDSMALSLRLTNPDLNQLNQRYVGSKLTKRTSKELIDSQSPDRQSTKNNSSKNNLSQPFRNLDQNSWKTHKDGAHRLKIFRQQIIRSSDVEENPGPQDLGTGPQAPRMRDRLTTSAMETEKMKQVKIISYNVRGLGDESKLRHLINYCYKIKTGANCDNVICLQETYIENPGKIPYLWRGNFHLTPGRGNSLGCLTLLQPHINVIHSQDFESRAHILVCQKTGQQEPCFIICNLYAPNPNNVEKINFFEDLFNRVNDTGDRFNCNKLIIAGDYNLIFRSKECRLRAHTAQEKNVANSVKNLLQNLNLTDVWEKDNLFTWNRPNTEIFSTIDRVAHSKEYFKLITARTDWAVSLSDHAAIVITLGVVSTTASTKTRITRLDPSLLDGPDKERIIEEINRMLEGVPASWDPHQRLEFLKVCIRTVFENAQAERKRRELSEEELVNQELSTSITALERGELNVRQRLEIINYVEELRNRKTILVENKGKRLADRLGTKWYNEGERSNSYFLRILQRNTPNNFEGIQNDAGDLLVGEEEIETEIINFYKNLYEKDHQQPTANDPTFFDQISGVSAEEDLWVNRPITLKELGDVLDSCKNSTPGPDGIPYGIIRGLWTIFGPILINSWNHTLRTGTLPTSHKNSFLRLIPKAGKDLTKLTNWRPITLSNCDHKIVTKLYSIRIAEKVAKFIEERQTAYLKGRLINDNIRTLLGAIRTANLEDNVNGLIVSLDAKKAFDSVDHNFIETTLRKFGLERFVPVFRALYSDLRSDIIINGKVVQGYNINRGVKQGDALSCILFIMCMEPLLKNIENNNEIKNLRSLDLETNLPKVLAYADDVNGIVVNDQKTIQELFKEYERLTRLANLELNAEKTEIMPITSNNLNLDKDQMIFRFSYCQKNYELKPVPEMKINGILFQQDEAAMKTSNMDNVKRRIEAQLKNWSTRQLSVLGKILILKTFGISQVIYLMQSMSLCDNDVKQLNAILYKFIWNRHFCAAKAPERIRREIVNKPIRLGGLGMLDLSMLSESLKLRALGRLLTTNHPFLTSVRNKIDLSDFFAPKITSKLDDLTIEGLRLLTKDRTKLLVSDRLDASTNFIRALRTIKIRRILNRNGVNSLAWFNLRRQGKTLIADLTRNDLRSLETFIERNLLERLKATPFNLNLNPVVGLDITTAIVYGSNFHQLTTLSSKAIRTSRSNVEPISVFKIGAILTPAQSINWANSLRKVTCVRHQDILLRLAHGELYSKERLHRYRLIDSAQCPRCDQIETLSHKYFECPYITEIWRRTLLITNKLRTSVNVNETLIEKALCCTNEPNTLALTIHAEIITRIRRLKDDEANLLLWPKLFVRNAITLVKKRELNVNLKVAIDELLEN